MLVLPEGGEAPHTLREVLVVTDHLAECGRLVDWGSRMTATDGHLTMVHMEDGVVFDRYSRAISRIPDLATDQTPPAILAQLLHEPRRFIESAKEVLATSRPGLKVDSVVEVASTVRLNLAARLQSVTRNGDPFRFYTKQVRTLQRTAVCHDSLHSSTNREHRTVNGAIILNKAIQSHISWLFSIVLT